MVLATLVFNCHSPPRFNGLTYSVWCFAGQITKIMWKWKITCVLGPYIEECYDYLSVWVAQLHFWSLEAVPQLIPDHLSEVLDTATDILRCMNIGRMSS